MEITLAEAALIAAVFVVAGGVKGVVGLGLPTVSLGILTAVVGLPTAMALILAPSFLTNVWQAVAGGAVGPVLRRIWPFLAGAALFIGPGVLLGGRLDGAGAAAPLGGLLIIYGGLALIPRAPARPAWAALPEPFAGPAAGVANGLLAGLTGASVMPGVPYLQSTGLPRQAFVQALGLLFAVSSLILAAALALAGRLSPDLGAASLLAVVPAVAGMELGRRVRHRLSEAVFRRCVFIALALLGVHLVAMGLL